ncbi:uncharacterized protein LOC135488642 [Lineus longissimus]|uniref:uncharacterized protein LOC135488642 n=1 Tax=Lineus longissimus TaxID=88925 RepID=UPI00315D05DB
MAACRSAHTHIPKKRCRAMPAKRRCGRKHSSSSNWRAEDAFEKLGVVYHGVDSDEGYKHLLHSPDTGANIPRTDVSSDDGLCTDLGIDLVVMYRKLMQELLDFDDASSEVLKLLTRVVPRGSRGPFRSPRRNESESDGGSDTDGSASDDDGGENVVSLDDHPVASSSGGAKDLHAQSVGSGCHDDDVAISTASAVTKPTSLGPGLGNPGLPNLPAARARTNSSSSCDSGSTCSVSSKDDALNAFLDSLAESKKKIRTKKDMLRPMHKFGSWYSSRCDCLLRFVSWVLKLVQLASNNQQIDEDSFRQLFINFALIFNMEIRLVNSRNPLILQGREVDANPDLLYEKYPEVTAIAPKQIFSVTVAECKGEAKPKKVKLQRPAANYPPQREKRPHSLIAQDSIAADSTIFPSDLKGQHACQLVNELGYTYMPNKNCMLGFVVQGTKVRLTCLIMDRELNKRIREPEFEALLERSEAKIYFTKTFDMLQKQGRQHLAYIMVTLSSFAGDSNIN